MIKRGIHWYQGVLVPTFCSEPLNRKGVMSANTTIHSARVSLTVVATSSELTPCSANHSGCIWSYAAPAPTTDEVSWIAIAAHIPKSFILIPSAVPIWGKMNKAMAFNRNTTPSATDMFSPLALIMGPTVAMAEPPQIAVPELMRKLVCVSTFNNLRPNIQPKSSVPKRWWL